LFFQNFQKNTHFNQVEYYFVINGGDGIVSAFTNITIGDVDYAAMDMKIQTRFDWVLNLKKKTKN
jgi:hypothetical protein